MKEAFKKLGKRLKLLRMESGITQTDMAQSIGLSQTNLSNMESGRTAITIQNLFKIQKVLNCNMSDFFVDFDIKKNNEVEQESNEVEIEEAIRLLKLMKEKNIKIKGL